MPVCINRVTLLGYLGRDPEEYEMPFGRIVGLSLATSEAWEDKEGQRQERVEWHRITITNETLAELALKRLRKGSRVYVEGQLQTRKWTDPDGSERLIPSVAVGYRGVLIVL